MRADDSAEGWLCAPEEYDGEGQGPWTDVYGLSAVLYRGITGRKPDHAMQRVIREELQMRPGRGSGSIADWSEF